MDGMDPLKVQVIISFVVGFIFAIGLALSGMTQPHIVIGFLDPLNWNPTLLFVMIGAIFVHGVSFYFLKKRKTPFLDKQWHIPRNRKIDTKLIFGAIIFGVGWGLGGYCPGPAVTSLSTGSLEVLGFVLMMLAGMKLATLLIRR